MATLLTAAPSNTLKISASVSVSYSYKTTTHLQHSIKLLTHGEAPAPPATWPPGIQGLRLYRRRHTRTGIFGPLSQRRISRSKCRIVGCSKTQQLTFPKQAYRVFLRRRFGVAIPQIPLRHCTSVSAQKEGNALSRMTPWPYVFAIWQKQPVLMLSSRTRTSSALSTPRTARGLTSSSSASKRIRSLAMSSSRNRVARPSPDIRLRPKVGQPEKEKSPRGPSTAGQPLPFVFETYGLWGKSYGVPRYPRSCYQHVLAQKDLKTMAEGSCTPELRSLL